MLVASIRQDFQASHDPDRERGFIAERDGKRLGCIFCVCLDDQTAKLRLFLLMPHVRGLGLGRHMLQVCMDYARNAGYCRMVLWTHASHTAACALYKQTGWQVVSFATVRSFGVDLVKQGWQIIF